MVSLSTPDNQTISSSTPAGETPLRRACAHTSARFWVCLVILVVSAVGLRAASGLFGWVFRKEAVELKKPLQLFDARQLGPRYERAPETDSIPPLSEDMIQSLGTREYLQLYVNDTQKAPNDPTRLANVFVTYYTGKPDMVPHVPDECYLAGGYDRIGQDMAHVHVRGAGAPDDEVPVRVLQFQDRRSHSLSGIGQGSAATVLYFFHLNGGYAAKRDEVRLKLSNPFQRHAYYAKIEITFPGTLAMPVAEAKAASLAGLGPLLEHVMPVLLEDHFRLDAFSSDESVSERSQE